MKLKDNFHFLFVTEIEENEFYKTLILSLGLAPRIVDAFDNAGIHRIRSIAGILRKREEDLLEFRGIGVKALSDVKRKIQQAYEKLRSPSQFIASDDYYFTMSTPAMDIRNDTLPPVLGEISRPIDKTILFKGGGEKDVMATLARYLGFGKDQIKEHTRRHEIVQARQIIMYLLREYAGMSFPAIGRLIGGRDHTTVIHGYKKIKAQILVNAELEHNLRDAIALAKGIHKRKRYAEEAIKNLKDAIQKESISSSALRIRLPQKQKKISGRNMKILELYREGLTLQNIASTIKLTRERVRQIIETTIESLAINESISSGVEIDASVLKDEEKRKRRLLKTPAPIKIPKEHRWTRYYIACKSCGTTTIPHLRKGLCEQCLGVFSGERREEFLKQHGKCELCGILRREAVILYGRDFYITKDKKVYCRECFLKFTGKKLSGYKNYAWSRFYPKCIKCGTVSTPHYARGLCEDCTDILSNEKREKIINEHSKKCDECRIERDTAKKKLGRDLHITSNRNVLCRTCFQKYRRTQQRVIKRTNSIMKPI
ncbi:hypothetical protein A3I46_03395 [Candidatus Kaiserbacteria bacterium RIFCSPLOWO2_02_FULL_54_13]|uniref:Chromosomal replication initiator DnaA C-terminal domain-containing protein n=1 Tax=Candidatus Kaiserbacteria bacterium RIFCSPHIGHO2_02_FULL_54_22 TaxID=1798495 RepID=A0A1F6DM93_9BACT|nr:MAG: hypothetical protein A3C19_01055 [Candidatus Kaiserbacteria bacterium RIFCSPHIGHO2_02_FULL_54_22]OGG67919.1 MAG: hypothetical protein A3E99_03050 [Candidatus Kaiserbacteria bacterium RIFCSPHIGHO2_12_FULL_54_16]OGG82515.1 MAG: hypothetical protein A3I46_03395 [Candidatus Kaiserbacteria bacterium RIFCSPLOWO2_02_FULL_54_13]OGG89813.1 MAG: hypothetical protein A3G12_01910 [Candidatus Kaiserbacteria bacterium RIFCSPLOWO2_12_FULL_54_10]